MASRWAKIIPGATGNKAEFLVDGTASFKSIADAIKTANKDGHYIYVMGWMLDVGMELIKGDSGSAFIKLLEDAAKKGAEVRVLVWDNPIPNANPPESYIQLNRDGIPKLNKLPNTFAFIDDNTFATAATQTFLTQAVPHILKQVMKFQTIFKELDLFFTILKYAATKNVGSHHDKVVIVKGEKGLISFCGGIDININRFEWYQKQWCSFHKDTHTAYHDTHIKVEGPAAYDILQKFIKRWDYHPAAKSKTLKGRSEPKPKEIKTGDFRWAKTVGTYNDPSGKDRDRSLKDAYLEILRNAQKYVYIEDQYLVNLDVAKELNKRIKDPNFVCVVIVTQDCAETTDILIPLRRRSEFYKELIKGASQTQQDKVGIFIVDIVNGKKNGWHTGVHAKTLIVDDELAIIGSANVNQRSFTNDSETSVIVFDDPEKKTTFAKDLRIAIWKEFIRVAVAPQGYESWYMFMYLVKNVPGFSILLDLTKTPQQEDLDEKIIAIIKKSGVIAPIVVGHLTGNNLQQTTVALSPITLKMIFDMFWENVVDPEAP
jgi:phosphatidylserine/phosphatidylglycerophosphate/cardiolipin synthase-like enzyme